MKIKQYIQFTLLMGLLLTLGFGCKGLTAQQKAAIKPVVLNYWTVYDNVEVLQKFATQYEHRYPYVRINIRKVPYGQFDSLFTNALADDVGPDIVSINVRDLGKYQRRLATMPTSIHMASVIIKTGIQKQTIVTEQTLAMPSIRDIQSAMVSTVADDVVRNGKIYGLPLSVDTMALYYNKDLLDKSNIPEPPKTWNDFLTDVEQATKFDSHGKIIQSGVAMGTGTNISNAPDIVALLMLQNSLHMTSGGSVTFANGLKNNGKNSPAYQALRFYTDFANPSKQAYSWDATQGTALDNFARGKSVFYLGFAFDKNQIIAQAPQLNIQVVQLPQLNSVSPSNVANYWIETVVKKSAHKDAAWDFIRFLTLPQNITAYDKAANEPTPLRSQIKKQKKDPFLGAFTSQMLYATNWYRGNDYITGQKALRDMINAFITPAQKGQDKIGYQIGLIQQAAAIMQQGI